MSGSLSRIRGRFQNICLSLRKICFRGSHIRLSLRRMSGKLSRICGIPLTHLFEQPTQARESLPQVWECAPSIAKRSAQLSLSTRKIARPSQAARLFRLVISDCSLYEYLNRKELLRPSADPQTQPPPQPLTRPAVNPSASNP
jgi:hypothetical protein